MLIVSRDQESGIPMELTAPLGTTQSHARDPGHINQLPVELVSRIYAYLDSPADKWAFLLTQKRWLETSIDDIWLRPGIASDDQLASVCATLASSNPLFEYARMVRRLNLSAVKHAVDDRALAPFLSCGELERLVLVGAENLSDDAVCALIARNPQLTSIDISHVQGLTDNVLHTLARSCNWLQGIYAAGCELFSDAGVVQLANSCQLLKRVRFSGCPLVTSIGIQAVVANCPHIVELDLSLTGKFTGNGIDDETVRMLLLQLPMLRELRLAGHAQLTDDAFALPTSSSESEQPQAAIWLENMRLIDVSSCPNLGDEAVERLVSVAPRLHHVSLGRCPRISDNSLFQLAKLESSLHYLHLGHCVSITDRGVAQITKNCPRLQYIDVANCMHLTNATVRGLSTLPKLRRIGLVKCVQIDDLGILSLTERTWQENALERIHLSYCSAITSQAIMMLVNACPRLTHLSLTGVQSFMRSEFTQFCRAPPPDLTQHQQAVFCVYSGAGVQRLRDYLNRMPPENHLLGGPPDVATPPVPRHL